MQILFSVTGLPRRVAARVRCDENPGTKTAAPERGRGRKSTTRRSASERFDSGVQARQLARRGVLVNDTLADAAMQLGLRFREGGARRLLVAAFDRRLDLLDEGAQTRHAGAVDRGVTLGLTDPLLGRFMSGHCRPLQLDWLYGSAGYNDAAPRRQVRRRRCACSAFSCVTQRGGRNPPALLSQPPLLRDAKKRRCPPRPRPR